MTINRIHIFGYRSLRNAYVDLQQLNVIVGANGSGKSNFYRALYLLWTAATGQFARELANEGGISSVLWAGARRKNEEPKVLVEVELDELDFTFIFGRIPHSEVFMPDFLCFSNDPDIKEEEMRINYRGKSSVLLRRASGMISAKNMEGRNIEYPLALTGRESVLSGLRDPQKFPELSQLREELLNWRFYHHFRTDLESPLRQPQIGVITPPTILLTSC
jgi:predicted ATPase